MESTIQEMMQRGIRARREKKLVEAKQAWTEATALSRRAGRPGELIESLKGLAQIECDLGHHGEALPLYQEAVALCREKDDALLLAHSVRHLGDVHRRLSQWQLAESCYLEALTVYRSNEATRALDLANAIRPMAMLKERAGEFAQARALWEEARRLYESADVKEGAAESEKRAAALGE